MRVGIDLGGTKIEALAIDGRGAELWRKRVPTPAGDYEGTIAAIKALVKELELSLGVAGAKVGVGMPGAISPASGLVKNANSTCLIGRPFHRDLERALERPVRVANDANCFALSEAVDGAGAGARVVFGVIMGTGCGGGIVVDGKVLVGPNAIAGEWGHNPLPWASSGELSGPACYCGKVGCIESFLAGPSMTRDHAERTGHQLTPDRIAALAEGGDGAAEETLVRYEDRLARALVTVLNVLDPDVVVLGGGVSNIGRLYVNVPRTWSRYAFSDEIATRLVKAVHGDSSGVRGAAWLWSS